MFKFCENLNFEILIRSNENGNLNWLVKASFCRSEGRLVLGLLPTLFITAIRYENSFVISDANTKRYLFCMLLKIIAMYRYTLRLAPLRWNSMKFSKFSTARKGCWTRDPGIPLQTGPPARSRLHHFRKIELVFYPVSNQNSNHYSFSHCIYLHSLNKIALLFKKNLLHF